MVAQAQIFKEPGLFHFYKTYQKTPLICALIIKQIVQENRDMTGMYNNHNLTILNEIYRSNVLKFFYEDQTAMNYDKTTILTLYCFNQMF